jgi:Ca2+-binding RTX toxin-like protein
LSDATLSGGLAPFNFTAQNQTYDAYAQADFSNLFGQGILVGAQSITFNGSGIMPDPSLSPNKTLALTASMNTDIPPGFAAVYDLTGSDTVTGSDLTVFLQGGLSQGSIFNVGNGNDKIYAGGSDTITAGAGSNTVIGGSSGPISLNGTGSSNLYFVGGDSAVSVVGAFNSTLFGGAGPSTSFLQGGAGDNTLVGGSGTGATTMGGGHNEVEFALGAGPTTLFAGTGNSTLVGATGRGLELFSTNPLGNSGSALIGFNGAADTLIGGSGNSTVVGGAGPDTYAFLAGHAGGSETILGLKQGDTIVFGNYSAGAIKSEDVSHGSDHITLSDGTSINLVNIDHKLFS